MASTSTCTGVAMRLLSKVSIYIACAEQRHPVVGSFGSQPHAQPAAQGLCTTHQVDVTFITSLSPSMH